MKHIKNFSEIKVGDRIFFARVDNDLKVYTGVISVKTIVVRRYGRYFSTAKGNVHDIPYDACFITSSNLSRSVQKSSGFNIRLYCTDESLVSENVNKVIANLIYRHNMHILGLPF